MGNQGFRNVRRDCVFKTDYIGETLVKLSGPNRGAVAHVEQLNRHADAITGAPEPAVQYESGPKFTAGDNRISVGAVTQNTAGRPHCKTPNTAEARDQGVSQSHPQIVRTRVTTLIHFHQLQGQYGQ